MAARAAPVRGSEDTGGLTNCWSASPFSMPPPPIGPMRMPPRPPPPPGAGLGRPVLNARRPPSRMSEAGGELAETGDRGLTAEAAQRCRARDVELKRAVGRAATLAAEDRARSERAGRRESILRWTGVEVGCGGRASRRAGQGDLMRRVGWRLGGSSNLPETPDEVRQPSDAQHASRYRASPAAPALSPLPDPVPSRTRPCPAELPSER